MKTIII